MDEAGKSKHYTMYRKNRIRLLLTAAWVLLFNVNSQGQSGLAYFGGYNTFNEVYGGVQLPSRTNTAFAFEVAYQWTLQQEAQYHVGGLSLPTPVLSSYCSGFRTRAAVVFPAKIKHGNFSLALEYQKLESCDLIDDQGKFSGSHTGAYSKFKESYDNIGLKLYTLVPLFRSHRIFFTYSLGFIIKSVQRQYSIEGLYKNKIPSDRHENFLTSAFQTTAGLRFYIRAPN